MRIGPHALTVRILDADARQGLLMAATSRS